MRFDSWLRASIFVLLLAASAAPAHAQLAHGDEERDLDARLSVLDHDLAQLQRPTRAYAYSWISALAALGVGQVVYAFVANDPADRTAVIIGAGLSVTGIALTAALPNPGRYASKRFRALPEATLEDKRAKVHAGERWLEGEAKAVRRARAWWVHAMAVGFGLGAGLGLWFGYHDLWVALRSGIGSFAFIELRIWTRPTQAIKYLDRYRAQFPARSDVALLPWLAPSGGGLRLHASF